MAASEDVTEMQLLNKIVYLNLANYYEQKMAKDNAEVRFEFHILSTFLVQIKKKIWTCISKFVCIYR